MIEFAKIVLCIVIVLVACYFIGVIAWIAGAVAQFISLEEIVWLIGIVIALALGVWVVYEVIFT